MHSRLSNKWTSGNYCSLSTLQCLQSSAHLTLLLVPLQLLVLYCSRCARMNCLFLVRHHFINININKAIFCYTLRRLKTNRKSFTVPASVLPVDELPCKHSTCLTNTAGHFHARVHTPECTDLVTYWFHTPQNTPSKNIHDSFACIINTHTLV